LRLAKFTAAPPSGAGPLSVRVMVAVPPAVTVDGLTTSELSDTADVVGVTVTVAYLPAPPYPAPRLMAVVVVTVPACTLKLPLY
jgi:hypothetical protein